MKRCTRGCDMAQQHPATRCRGATTLAAARATRRAAGFGLRYNFLIVTRGGDDITTCASDTTCDTTSARCDMAGRGPLYSASAHHDTAPNARRARGLGHGCVHCALDPVLTQCTVLSHYLEHYSWTLFMRFSKKITKIKKYKNFKNFLVYDLIYGIFILHLL